LWLVLLECWVVLVWLWLMLVLLGWERLLLMRLGWRAWKICSCWRLQMQALGWKKL
jgi:hypothetical protein